MTEPVTLWANPRCSKSRGAEALLAERGVPVERVLYLETPPSRAEIARVLALLGTDDPRALTRTGEPLYRDLGLADADRESLLDALAAHPSLLERPVVVRGDRAVVARPPERLLALLDDPS
jgi:arsenate reductase (glutaredoxin)